MPGVKILRRVLYWQAALWSLSGVALTLLPRPIVRGLLDQRQMPDYAWVQLVGILMFGMATLMVLVAHRIEELWWWCWSFVLTGAVISLLAFLNAVVGLPEGSSAWPWWLLAGVSALFTGGLVVGLAITGTQRTVV
jgi:hypothetical protein